MSTPCNENDDPRQATIHAGTGREGEVCLHFREGQQPVNPPELNNFSTTHLQPGRLPGSKKAPLRCHGQKTSIH
jgi:hypothetical protein